VRRFNLLILVSSNVFDSLAEAYVADKNTEAAIWELKKRFRQTLAMFVYEGRTSQITTIKKNNARTKL
jgi:hypothetical protein